MAYEHFKKPARGEVWFSGGVKVPGRVFGAEGKFAQADVAKKDLERLFEALDVEVDDDETGWVTLKGEQRLERAKVERGRVYLGGGWPLRYKLVGEGGA